MNRSWNFRRGVLLALAGYTAFLVFAAPQRCCADALQAGLRLCGGPLLVSLFPFLIVSALAAGCGPGSGWALCSGLRRGSWASGQRVRAACCSLGPWGLCTGGGGCVEAVRTGQLTSRQASALLPACVQRAVLCHPHGRAADAGQPRGGVRLFAAQLLAGYLTAALLCRMQGGAGQAPPAQGGNHSAARTGRGDRAGGSDLPEALRLCAVLPAAGGRVRGIAATAVGGAARHAAGSVFRLRSGRPHRAVGQHAVLCGAQCAGVSVLLQVRTICPAEISLRPLLAARAVHLPLSVALFWLGSTVPVQAVQTLPP